MELLTVNSCGLQAVRRRLSCDVLRRHQVVFNVFSDLQWFQCFLSSAQVGCIRSQLIGSSDRWSDPSLCRWCLWKCTCSKSSAVKSSVSCKCQQHEQLLRIVWLKTSCWIWYNNWQSCFWVVLHGDTHLPWSSGHSFYTTTGRVWVSAATHSTILIPYNMTRITFLLTCRWQVHLPDVHARACWYLLAVSNGLIDLRIFAVRKERGGSNFNGSQRSFKPGYFLLAPFFSYECFSTRLIPQVTA